MGVPQIIVGSASGPGQMYRLILEPSTTPLQASPAPPQIHAFTPQQNHQITLSLQPENIHHQPRNSQNNVRLCFSNNILIDLNFIELSLD